MEVHHHTAAGGKKWTHYLWEFFMLFLAVFLPDRRTIDQLENSGGLTLLKKSHVSDSIIDYYHHVTGIVDQGNTWLRYFDQYHEIAFQVFDYSQIDSIFFEREKILGSTKHYSLITDEPSKMKLLYNKLFALRFILEIYRTDLGSLKEQATDLLNFLNKEYQ